MIDKSPVSIKLKIELTSWGNIGAKPESKLFTRVLARLKNVGASAVMFEMMDSRPLWISSTPPFPLKTLLSPSMTEVMPGRKSLIMERFTPSSDVCMFCSESL